MAARTDTHGPVPEEGTHGPAVFQPFSSYPTCGFLIGDNTPTSPIGRSTTCLCREESHSFDDAWIPVIREKEKSATPHISSSGEM